MIKNERGFTIMELLVVIVIIGVLAAIGVPAYNNMTTRARIAACQANQRTLQTAVGMCYADTNAYPADLGAALALYLDNAASIKCPSGGTYSLDANHKVQCSETGHTIP